MTPFAPIVPASSAETARTVPGPSARAAGRILARACALALLGGCTAMNPFLANYQGERLPAVPVASVVAAPPADTAARSIGTSRFLLTAPHEEDGAAVAAAREVGADQVVLTCRNLGAEEWVETDPVYERRASGRGQFASYIPLPGSREHWECKATFWRSFSADQAPAPSPGSTPSATPGSRPASGS